MWPVSLVPHNSFASRFHPEGQREQEWYWTSKCLYIILSEWEWDYQMETQVFIHKRVISSVIIVEFLSNMILWHYWYGIRALNMFQHWECPGRKESWILSQNIRDQPTYAEQKHTTQNMFSFYELLEHVFNHSLHTQFLVDDYKK